MIQNIWLTLVITGSVGIFIYDRFNEKIIHEYSQVILFLGLVLTFLGSLLVLSIYGIDSLKDCLLLREFENIGRFIPGGYIFLLMWGFDFLDKSIHSLYE